MIEAAGILEVSRSRAPMLRWRLVIVIALVSIGAALAAFVITSTIASSTPWQVIVESYTLTNIVIGLSCLVSGGLIGWFRPKNAVGWLFLASGLGHLVAAGLAMVLRFGVESGWPETTTRSLTTVFHLGWLIGLPGLFLLALLLFPTGRLPSRWWRAVAVAVIVQTGYNVVTAALSPESLLGSPATVSILSSGYVPATGLAAAVSIVGGALYALVAASLVTRYRNGDEQTKSQLLWLILAIVAAGVLNSQRWATGNGPILPLLGISLVPIAIAIAIVRYRLLDIRLVLSRTLVYTLAIATVIAVYATLVSATALLVPSDAERGLSIAAAILVAVAFTPVRLLFQRLINRAFYGSRGDLAGAAFRMSERMQRTDDDLVNLLERARLDLKLPYLSIRSTDDYQVATAGQLDADAPAASVPLSHRGEPLATLHVGLRRGERSIHPSDLRTLTMIATPLAVAHHAIELTDQVRAARATIVQAREWERQRLYRDLHDGLGPDLTSVAFRADAVSNLVRSDPDRALKLLGELRQQVRSSINDVRRVVYGLRPIELDKHGLEGALMRRVASANNDSDRRLVVTATMPAQMAGLSPATELATYRIVSEGLANALRHSGATSCTIDISMGASLRIVITDNGSRGQDWAPGVGVASMIDRAEELGGSASAGPTSSGWSVIADLPLSV